MNMHERCTVCAQTIITKTHFSKIKRNYSLLQLIHSDVCDMHSTPIRGGKKICDLY